MEKTAPAYRYNEEAPPNIYSSERYIKYTHIDIDGDYEYVK